MTPTSRFARRIRPSVQAELDAAVVSEAERNAGAAFEHLERAHVLGQASTVEHVRVHWAMLRWALRNHELREAWGQVWRIVGASSKTWLWVPAGNTGGARISGFKSMPVPAELQRLIDAART